MNTRNAMMSRTMKLILVVLLSLPLSGCWDRKELNELGVISATGIDWEDGKWVATTQLVLPLSTTGEGSGRQLTLSPVDVFSMTGEGIRSSFRKASLESTRQLYFSHNQVVVIGESAARKGINQLLDVYLRNMDAREDVTVFLTEGKASVLLRQLSPSEWNPGNGLRKMIEAEAKQYSRFRVMRVFDVIAELLGPAQSTAIPVVRLSGKPDVLTSVDAQKRTKLDARIKLGQVGLVKKNRLVGFAKMEESLGMMWLGDRIGHTQVSYACKEGEERRSSSIVVTKAKTKVTPYLSNGRLRMLVRVKVNGTIEEFTCADDLAKLVTVKQQEKLVEDEIRAIMMKGWEVSKRMKTDTIGFGARVFERYPRLWKQMEKDWDEEFARLDPEIQVEVHIKGTGSSNPSISSYQEKP